MNQKQIRAAVEAMLLDVYKRQAEADKGGTRKTAEALPLL